MMGGRFIEKCQELAAGVLLVALFLRALMPVGWMPNPYGITTGVPIVICTGHGPINAPPPPPGKHGNHHQEPCVYAAAPAHATQTPALPALYPLAEPIIARVGVAHALIVIVPRERAHSPRAPPRRV